MTSSALLQAALQFGQSLFKDNLLNSYAVELSSSHSIPSLHCRSSNGLCDLSSGILRTGSSFKLIVRCFKFLPHLFDRFGGVSSIKHTVWILELLRRWLILSAHHHPSCVLKCPLTAMKVRVRQVIRAFANPVAKYVYRCSYRWPRVSQVPFLQ